MRAAPTFHRDRRIGCRLVRYGRSGGGVVRALAGVPGAGRETLETPAGNEGYDDGQKRQCAAEGKERAPAEHRHDVSGDERGERAAERDADDGQRDGEWPVPAWHAPGRERGRVGHRPAETEAGKEPQDAEGPEAIDERGGGRQDAEDEDAADERDAPAHAIADDAGQRSAEHHADHAARDNRPEVAARHGPVTHHRGTAMPSSWLSTPSKTIVSAVSSTNSFCRLPQWPSSSSWPTSTVWCCDIGAPLWCQVLYFNTRVGPQLQPNVEIQDLTPRAWRA